MSVEEALEILKTNKEDTKIQSFLDEVVSGKKESIINEFKASKEYKEELNREGDRRANGAVESFMKDKMPNHIKKAVEEKIKELNPEETPAQKENRELKERLDKIEKENAAKDFKIKAGNLINEKKLHPDSLSLLQKMNFNDDDDLNKTVETFNSIFESVVEQRFNEKLKTAGGQPVKSKDTNAGSITREMLKEMPPEEINKLRLEGKLDGILTGN
jgi:hypothetical protein